MIEGPNLQVIYIQMLISLWIIWRTTN